MKASSINNIIPNILYVWTKNNLKTVLLNFMVILNIDGEGRHLHKGVCKGKYKDLYAKSEGIVVIICRSIASLNCLGFS